MSYFFLTWSDILILIIYISSSSPSCRAASTDIPDPLSPLLPIIHRLWQVFWATSYILTYVQAGRPDFAWPYAVVHRSTSLMSSSLLLQQCPACLVRLTWIVIVMGGRYYLPTPPLGQDMTQGQFLSGV